MHVRRMLILATGARRNELNNPDLEMDESSVIVYTCVTNGRDGLREDQCVEGAQFHAFGDEAGAEGSVWIARPASGIFASPRRNARMHKILSHQFIDSQYSIWMDANVALRVPAARLIDEYLKDTDMAVFRHRTRACTYEEAARCRELGLDAPDVIDRQMDTYRRAGFSAQAGLPETTVLIRRHGPAVQRFNEAWWSELCRHSVRDQLSFMYAAARSGVDFRFITPTKFDHPYFSMTVRPPGIEPAA